MDVTCYHLPLGWNAELAVSTLEKCKMFNETFALTPS